MAIICTNEEKKELKFPTLMISSIDGTIILATSAQAGTVIKRGMIQGTNTPSYLDIGYYSRTWLRENFSLYTGKVVLKNEPEKLTEPTKETVLIMQNTAGVILACEKCVNTFNTIPKNYSYCPYCGRKMI